MGDRIALAAPKSLLTVTTLVPTVVVTPQPTKGGRSNEELVSEGVDGGGGHRAEELGARPLSESGDPFEMWKLGETPWAADHLLIGTATPRSPLTTNRLASHPLPAGTTTSGSARSPPTATAFKTLVLQPR